MKELKKAEEITSMVNGEKVPYHVPKIMGDPRFREPPKITARRCQGSRPRSARTWQLP